MVFGPLGTLGRFLSLRNLEASLASVRRKETRIETALFNNDKIDQSEMITVVPSFIGQIFDRLFIFGVSRITIIFIIFFTILSYFTYRLGFIIHNLTSGQL